MEGEGKRGRESRAGEKGSREKEVSGAAELLCPLASAPAPEPPIPGLKLMCDCPRTLPHPGPAAPPLPEGTRGDARWDQALG